MKTFGFQEPKPARAPLPAPAWREPPAPADAPPTPLATPSRGADAVPTPPPIAARATRCSVCELQRAPSEEGVSHPLTGAWCCTVACLKSPNAQPNKTCVDGGNVADRARLAPPAPAAPKDREIRCPVCRLAVHFVAHDATDASNEALLDAHGWTNGFPRVCSATCAMDAPKSISSAVDDRAYQMARAAARRRAGQPELPEHRGLLPPSKTT